MEAVFIICGTIIWVCSVIMFYMAMDTYRAGKALLIALHDIIRKAVDEKNNQ